MNAYPISDERETLASLQTAANCRKQAFAFIDSCERNGDFSTVTLVQLSEEKGRVASRWNCFLVGNHPRVVESALKPTSGRSVVFGEVGEWGCRRIRRSIRCTQGLRRSAGRNLPDGALSLLPDRSDRGTRRD